MDFCLFFLATIVAYRMGARGVWLFAIFMFSWLALVPWLILRDEKPRREDAERKREDAELERTLMIVRAINPQMADKIEVEQAIERTLAAGRKPAKPAKPPPRPGRGRCIAFAAVAVFVGLVLIGTLVPPLVVQQSTDVSLSEHVDGVRSVGMPWHGRGE